MSQVSDRSFSAGWIAVSFFMIFGGLVIMLVLLGLLKIQSEIAGYGAFLLGGMLGGFFAGRASPHRSIIEPAVAGALVIGTIFAAFALTPLGRFVFELSGGEITRTALLVGALTSAGGVGGAVLGEKSSQGRPPPTGRGAWLGYGTLISLGSIFSILAVTMLLLVGDGPGSLPSMGSMMGAIFLGLALAAMVGGLISQAIAPAKMITTAGLGPLLAMFAVGILGIVNNPHADASGFGGLVIIAVPMFGLGCLGASIGWAMIKKKVEAAAAHSAERLGEAFD